MKGRGLLYGLIAVDALAFVGFGCLATLGLAAMLPYGHPRPSAETVLAIYAAEFVVAPAVILLLLAKLALILLAKGKELTACTLLLLPWLSWPFFFLRALA